MAFSTQNDFLKLDFVMDACQRSKNEDYKTYRAAIKTYSSCTDSRAWSLSNENQTKYLQDMVVYGVHFSEADEGDEIKKNVVDKLSGKGRLRIDATGCNAAVEDAKSIIERENSELWQTFVIKRGEPQDFNDSSPKLKWNNLNEEFPKDTTRLAGFDFKQKSAARPASKIEFVIGPVSSQSLYTGGGNAEAGIVTLSADSMSERTVGIGNKRLHPNTSKDLNTSDLPSAASSVKFMGQKTLSAIWPDKLIEAACIKLNEINSIVRNKSNLRNNLEYSEEGALEYLNEGSQIKSTTSAEIEDDLNILKENGQVNPEKIMIVYNNDLEDIKKCNQHPFVVKTENDSSRKRLAEPDTQVQIGVPKKIGSNTDVNYLLFTVDTLHHEVKRLQIIQDDRAQLQLEFDNLKEAIKKMDGPKYFPDMKNAAAKLDEIKFDRDRLINLISLIVGVEDEIKKMKKRAYKAQQLKKELTGLRTETCNGVNVEFSHGEMQKEINRLRKEKEEDENKLGNTLLKLSQMQEQQNKYIRVLWELHRYKIHYNAVVNELRRVSTKIIQIEPELEETKLQLIAAKIAVLSYEKQMDELTDVIRELEHERHHLSNTEGNSKNTKDGNVKELLSISKNVIQLFQQEIKSRRNFQNELKACKTELAVVNKNLLIEKKNQWYTNSLNTLIKELETCKNVKEGFETGIKTLKSKVSGKDIEDLLDQLNACKRENQRLLTAVERDKGIRSDQFDTIFDELNRCRASLKIVSAENRKLKNTVDELRLLTYASHKENGSFTLLQEKESLDVCQPQLVELEQQIAKLTAKLKNSDNVNRELKEYLKQDQASFEKQLDEACRNLEMKDEHFKISSCNEQLAKLKDELREQTEKCEIEKHQTQKQVEELKVAKLFLNKTGNQISLRVNDLEKLLMECNKEKLILQKERDEANSYLYQIQTKYENEINRLQTDLDAKLYAYEKENKNLSKSLSKLRGQENNFHSALDVKTQDQSLYNGNCKKLKADLNNLTDKYLELESRYESLQQHDTSIHKALGELRKQYENKSLESTKEFNEQKSLLEQAKTYLEAQQPEISRLNNVLKQNLCKELEYKLVHIGTENEKLKRENDELKESLMSKEKLIELLKEKVENGATNLDNFGTDLSASNCSKYIEEIERLRNVVDKHLNEINDQGSLLNALREEVKAAKAAKLEIEYELGKAKSDKEALNKQLKTHVSTTKMIASKQELKIVDENALKDDYNLSCLIERSHLKGENERFQNEFKQLENLVKDIEEERQKNKQLELVIEDCERKINNLQNQSTRPKANPTFNIENAINELKQQLQSETDKNNVLKVDLEACKHFSDDLQEKFDKCQWELQNYKLILMDEKQDLNDTQKDLQYCRNKLKISAVLRENDKIDALDNIGEIQLIRLPMLGCYQPQLEEASNQTSALKKYHEYIFKNNSHLLLREMNEKILADQIPVSFPGQNVEYSEQTGRFSESVFNVSEKRKKSSEVASMQQPSYSTFKETIRNIDKTTQGALFAQTVEKIETGSPHILVNKKLTLDASAAAVTDKTSQLFTSTINEIKSKQSVHLGKMQQMYEEQMQEMMKNHCREIQSLRMTNEVLQNMLEEIKPQSATLGIIPNKTGTSGDLSIDTCNGDKKLNIICLKITKTSINCLNIRELKYLHGAVYQAGVKMKSLSALCSEGIEKCCECTGFICCLPSVPKDADKKFIERINCLENELENANELLHCLRNRYESKSSCNHRCGLGHSKREIETVFTRNMFDYS